MKIKGITLDRGVYIATFKDDKWVLDEECSGEFSDEDDFARMTYEESEDCVLICPFSSEDRMPDLSIEHPIEHTEDGRVTLPADCFGKELNSKKGIVSQPIFFDKFMWSWRIQL